MLQLDSTSIPSVWPQYQIIAFESALVPAHEKTIDSLLEGALKSPAEIVIYGKFKPTLESLSTKYRQLGRQVRTIQLEQIKVEAIAQLFRSNQVVLLFLDSSYCPWFESQATFCLETMFEIQRSFLSEVGRILPQAFVHLPSVLGQDDFWARRGIFRAKDYSISRDFLDDPKRIQDNLPKPVGRFISSNINGRTSHPIIPREFDSLTLGKLASARESLVAEFVHWIDTASKIPWLRLDLEIPRENMLAEARATKPFLIEHRSNRNPGWKSICLHGIEAKKTLAYHQYGYKNRFDPNYHWTHIADLCPETKAFLQSEWPVQYFERVRFMLLEPEGYIAPHSDFLERRLTDMTNISLNQPVGCDMFLEGYGKVPWKSGDCRRIDLGINHCVYNGSQEDRFHIIVHGHIGNQAPRWNRLTAQSFLKAMETDPWP